MGYVIEATRATYDNLIITAAPPDWLLADVYSRYRSEGLLPVIFYQSVPSLMEFLQWHMDPQRTVLTAIRTHENKPPELCGMGWVGRPESTCAGFKKAECGIGMFKRQSDNTQNLIFGRLMLGYFFQSNQIDAIFGTTPSPNSLAVSYARKLGFDLYGPVPEFAAWRGQPTGAWISHLSKTKFLNVIMRNEEIEVKTESNPRETSDGR